LHFPSPPPASCLHKIFTVYHISCGPATRRLKTILGLIESHAKGVLLAPILSLSAAEIPWMHDRLCEWGMAQVEGLSLLRQYQRVGHTISTSIAGGHYSGQLGGSRWRGAGPPFLSRQTELVFHVAVKTRAPNISIG